MSAAWADVSGIWAGFYGLTTCRVLEMFTPTEGL